MMSIRRLFASIIVLVSVAVLILSTHPTEADDPLTGMDLQLTTATEAELAENAYDHISKFVHDKIDCNVPRLPILGDLSHPMNLTILREVRSTDPLGIYIFFAIRATQYVGIPANGCAPAQVSRARSACRVGHMVQSFVTLNHVTIGSASSLNLRATIYTVFDDPIASRSDAIGILDKFEGARIPAGIAGYDIGVRGQSCNFAEQGPIYSI